MHAVEVDMMLMDFTHNPFLHASQLTWQPLNNHPVLLLSPHLHVLKITFTIKGSNVFILKISD